MRPKISKTRQDIIRRIKSGEDIGIFLESGGKFKIAGAGAAFSKTEVDSIGQLLKEGILIPTNTGFVSSAKPYILKVSSSYNEVFDD